MQINQNRLYLFSFNHEKIEGMYIEMTDWSVLLVPFLLTFAILYEVLKIMIYLYNVPCVCSFKTYAIIILSLFIFPHVLKKKIIVLSNKTLVNFFIVFI